MSRPTSYDDDLLAALAAARSAAIAEVLEDDPVLTAHDRAVVEACVLLEHCTGLTHRDRMFLLSSQDPAGLQADVYAAFMCMSRCDDPGVVAACRTFLRRRREAATTLKDRREAADRLSMFELGAGDAEASADLIVDCANAGSVEARAMLVLSAGPTRRSRDDALDAIALLDEFLRSDHDPELRTAMETMVGAICMTVICLSPLVREEPWRSQAEEAMSVFDEARSSIRPILGSFSKGEVADFEALASALRGRP